MSTVSQQIADLNRDVEYNSSEAGTSRAAEQVGKELAQTFGVELYCPVHCGTHLFSLREVEQLVHGLIADRADLVLDGRSSSTTDAGTEEFAPSHDSDPNNVCPQEELGWMDDGETYSEYIGSMVDARRRLHLGNAEVLTDQAKQTLGKSVQLHEVTFRTDGQGMPGTGIVSVDGERICQQCGAIERLHTTPTRIPGQTLINHPFVPLIPDPAYGKVQREPTCVANWPECHEGGYDPRCCRFPKACAVNTVLAPPPADTSWIKMVDLEDGGGVENARHALFDQRATWPSSHALDGPRFVVDDGVVLGRTTAPVVAGGLVEVILTPAGIAYVLGLPQHEKPVIQQTAPIDDPDGGRRGD